MIQILLAALAAPHLLAVDVAMAGPLVAAWLRWRAGRDGHPDCDGLARRLAWLSLGALALGSVLGAGLLAVRYLADDRAYLRALAAVPVDRIWFAGAELLFSFVCLGVYLALWNRLGRQPLVHGLFALAGSSNLMVHFPALFAVVAVVSSRRELAGASLDRAAYRRMLFDGEVLARVAHVWLAAAAVTGIVLAILALRTLPTEMSQAVRNRHLKFGARLALVASLLQFPAGAWLVIELPEGARGPLLGGDWLTTGLFLISLLLSVQLLHLLGAIALGDVDARLPLRALAVVSILVLLMVGTRLRLNGASQDQVNPAALGHLGKVVSGAANVPQGLALSGPSASIGSPARVACE